MKMTTSRYSKLAEITKLVNSKLDLRLSLEQVVVAISEEIINCDSVGIYLLQEDGTFRGYIGKPNTINGITLDQMVVDLKQDLLAKEIVETQKSIYIPDTSLDSRPDPIPIKLFHIKSLLGLPIVYGDELLGLVFLFDYNATMKLDGQEIETVEAYVSMAAVALRNAKIFKNKEDALNEKQLLLDAVRELSLCPTSQKVMNTCFLYVSKALNNLNIAGYLIDTVSKKITPTKLFGNSEWKEEDWQNVHQETKVNFEEDLVFQEVMTTKKYVYITDAINDPRPNKTAMKNFGIKGLLMMPLIAMGEVVGTVGVVSLDDYPNYSNTQIQLAQSIVDAAATALSSTLRQEELEKTVKARTLELIGKNKALENVVAQTKSLINQKELILNSAGESIYGIDLSGKIMFCNPAAAKMLNKSIDNLVDRHLDDIFDEFEYKDMFPFTLESSSINLTLKDGTVQYAVEELISKTSNQLLYIEYISNPIKEDNDIVGAVAIFRDITSRKQMEEKIHKQAYYDSLTGLPNRAFFNEVLDKTIENAKEHNNRVTVLFLDLDRFKLINDTLGHSIGDSLLKHTAHRLQNNLNLDHIKIIARLGGDEFVVLIDAGDETIIQNVASEIIRIINQPFYIDDHELFTTTSIGISNYPNDCNDKETLVRNADIAMYKAKEQSGNCYKYYNESMNYINSERARIINNLYKAMDNNEFSIHFQPKIDFERKTIIGTEALLRWQHPSEGMISPARFIPLAEESGSILRIGEWVLRTACKQNKKWQEMGFKDLSIAVNLSARQFYESNFIHTVQEILKETDLDPKYLEFELTENIIINNSTIIEKLHDLKSLGVKISIDDFGTGYSSLRYLKDLPIDSLKIDQSFIRGCTNDRKIQAITNAIISLAKNLDLDIIAEGIETEEELFYLINQKCYMGQGYYFSKPLNSKDATEKFFIQGRGIWD